MYLLLQLLKSSDGLAMSIFSPMNFEYHKKKPKPLAYKT